MLRQIQAWRPLQFGTLRAVFATVDLLLNQISVLSRTAVHLTCASGPEDCHFVGSPSAARICSMAHSQRSQMCLSMHLHPILQMSLVSQQSPVCRLTRRLCKQY